MPFRVGTEAKVSLDGGAGLGFARGVSQTDARWELKEVAEATRFGCQIDTPLGVEKAVEFAESRCRVGFAWATVPCAR